MPLDFREFFDAHVALVWRVLRALGVPEAHVPDVPLASGDSPDAALRGKRTTELVLRFCADLEDGMRDVFVLRFIEERSLAETAELLGLGINTVSSRVRLLRTQLERTLADGEHYLEAR